MGIGIAESFADSNRQVRQGVRMGIFLEGHARAVQHTALFALLGVSLWGADWAMDAGNAKKALFVRFGIAALLLFSAAIKLVVKSIPLNALVNYLALALGEIALVVLLGGLKGGAGLDAGAGQMLFFLLASPLLGAIYPFHLNVAGCAALALAPHLGGALLDLDFPHVAYAATVWPAAALAALAHRKIRQLQVEGARLRHEIESSALVDPVTGLLNQRGLEQAFQRMVKLGAFKPLQQFLLLVEIDGFDKIAADYGQEFALSLRGQFGQTIDLSFRSRDITASPAEEFACILQHIPREKAFDVAERFRGVVAEKEFGCAAAPSGKLKCTVSIGIVYADARDEIKTLLNQGRVATRQAKALGGNQCVCI